MFQTHGIYRECDLCDDRVADKRHPAEFLTDIHTEINQTWYALLFQGSAILLLAPHDRILHFGKINNANDAESTIYLKNDMITFNF